MKINAISAMSYGYGVNKASVTQNKAVTNPMQKDLLDYPKRYMPYQINFAGSGNYAKLPGIKLLKTVKDLPCLYCAQKMVSSNVIEGLNSQNAVISKTLGELAETITKKSGQIDNTGVVASIMKAAQKLPKTDSKTFIEGLEAGGKFVPEAIKRMASRPMTGSEYANMAIKTISQYEDGLMPVEREVFQMIRESFKKNPNQSISQIMAGLRTNKLNGFESSQTKIIKEIEEMAKATLSKATKDKVLAETEKSRMLLNGSNTQFPFKRKKFIEILNRIPLAKNDVEGMAKILEKAESIPTSGSDANAFIAKYSNRNVPTGKGSFVSRSDSEVIQRLLDPSRYSVEHIRPQATFKTGSGTYTGPKDVIENLALAHKQCNSDRGDMTLEAYMRMNPKAKESIQKHIDFLIGEIKAGRLKGLEHYPKQLQETFAHETDGRLVLDIKDIEEYVKKFMASKK